MNALELYKLQHGIKDRHTIVNKDDENSAITNLMLVHMKLRDKLHKDNNDYEKFVEAAAADIAKAAEKHLEQLLK